MEFPARALKGCLVPPPHSQSVSTSGREAATERPVRQLLGAATQDPFPLPFASPCCSVILPAVLWALVLPFPHSPDSASYLSARLYSAPLNFSDPHRLPLFSLPLLLLSASGAGRSGYPSEDFGYLSPAGHTPPPQLPLTEGHKINLRGPWPLSSPGIKVTVPDRLPPGGCLTLGLLTLNSAKLL